MLKTNFTREVSVDTHFGGVFFENRILE